MEAEGQRKRLTKKTEPSETTYGTPTPIQRKAASKIVRMFGRSIKMKTVKSTDAFTKNTHSTEVQPSYVGRNRTGHVEALLERAFNEGKRKISYTYKVYTYLKFLSQQGGDDFEVRGTKFIHKIWFRSWVVPLTFYKAITKSSLTISKQRLTLSKSLKVGGSGTATI